MFRNECGLVTLFPLEDSTCYVNNLEIKSPKKLSQGKISQQIFLFVILVNNFYSQGDFIMFGKSLFRFNHPQEAEKLREMTQVRFQCSKIQHSFI